MKTGVAIFLIAVVVLIVLAFLWDKLAPKVSKTVAARRARKNEQCDWEVDDLDLPDGSTQVRLVKPGEHPKLIGPAVPATLPHWEFDEVLIERRLEAQGKADALNRRLSA